MKKKILFTVIILLVQFADLKAQTMADTSFRPEVKNPKHRFEKGPAIQIDEGHYNYHTAEGRYLGFGRLATADGYRIYGSKGEFVKERLDTTYILVIANALQESNENNWDLPNPSAFTNQEIEVLKKWVLEGGRLFLIADHMPFAGAAQELAAVFGFEYLNCFALDQRHRRTEYFTYANKKLYSSPFTNPANSKAIDSVVTFVGSAFSIPAQAFPVLGLRGYSLFFPEKAWAFTDATPMKDGENYFQLAARDFGKGKVVVSGEAAMFSAQASGQYKSGMNQEEAKNNRELLLNILHWLEE